MLTCQGRQDQAGDCAEDGDDADGGPRLHPVAGNTSGQEQDLAPGPGQQQRRLPRHLGPQVVNSGLP